MKSDPTIRRHVRAMLDALDRASAAIADAQRARAVLARAGRTVELRVFGGHEPEGGDDADGTDQPCCGASAERRRRHPRPIP